MKFSSDVTKIRAKAKKIVWALGLHAFSFIMILVLLGVILGGFIFYKYAFLAERKEPEVSKNVLKFDSKTYQNVLEKMQTRGQ